MPFEWTINPYRGCSHACTYCFARNTHTYLDLDSGHDFDTKVVVKVNAPDLLRRELAMTAIAAAPISIGQAARVPVIKKAMTMPGSATWLTASPIRLCRRSTRKLPSRAQATEASTPISIGTRLSWTNSVLMRSPHGA
jgi:hypothetical protein